MEKQEIRLFTEFQKKLQIKFKNPDLLKQALSHTSWVYEQPVKSEIMGLQSNERLEFLGDSIVGFLIVEKLYAEYPQAPEGALARAKSVLGSEVLLSRAARSLQIGRFIFLGKGEERSGGKDRDSILADAFEAICGAIYLDSGIEKVRKLLESSLFPMLQDVFDDTICLDYKSKLQEHTQGAFKQLPEYTLVDISGPSHHPLFTVEVKLEGKALACGSGKTKKEAEQDAAEKGIQFLRANMDFS